MGPKQETRTRSARLPEPEGAGGPADGRATGCPCARGPSGFPTVTTESKGDCPSEMEPERMSEIKPSEFNVETQKPLGVERETLRTFALPRPSLPAEMLSAASAPQVQNSGAWTPPLPWGCRPDLWALRFLAGWKTLETGSQACLPPRAPASLGGRTVDTQRCWRMSYSFLSDLRPTSVNVHARCRRKCHRFFKITFQLVE